MTTPAAVVAAAAATSASRCGTSTKSSPSLTRPTRRRSTRCATLAEDAPDEISDEINDLLDLFDRLQAAGDDPEAIAELTEEAEGLQEGADRVTTYFEDECGIESETDTTE